MSGKYEGYLQALLAPLGLYDLTGGRQQGSELAALGAALDGVDDRLALAEREGLLATAEGTGLERREALFQRKPAAVTPEERREAIAALLRISEDSLTPEAINDTLTGCGIRAKAEETAEGLRVKEDGILRHLVALERPMLSREVPEQLSLFEETG